MEPASRVLASDFGVKRTAAAGRESGYEEMDEGSSVKTQACAAAIVLMMMVTVILMMLRWSDGCDVDGGGEDGDGGSDGDEGGDDNYDADG